MKKTFLILLGFLVTGSAILAQSVQATYLGNWQNDNIVIVPWLNGRYNEVWGLAVNGQEFAVLGSTAGMHFIDVTEPTDPQELFLVPGTSAGSNIVHRDFKDYNGYLYCVADEGGAATLQIIDIQDLPNSVTQVYASNEFVITSHNLFIDTSQARLYLLGAQGKTKILDISNPTQPVLLGSYPAANFFMPYVHDAYIRDNIGVFNCGYDGMWVIDFTDAANPVLLGTMTNYPGTGYNHSGWLSEDWQYFYLLDETHGSPVKVVDMSDYSDMKVVATMDAASAPTEIPHNAIIRGNLLYVSYYYDGLQVYDISNPLNPQRVAYYDTYAGPDDNFYAGAWGIYPLLPSGNILISDIQTGLWVFEALPEVLDLNLVPSESQFSACTGETLTFELNIGNDFSANGVTLEASGTNVPGTMTFEPNPAMPGSTVVITVADLNFTQGNAEEISIEANDGIHAVSTDIYLNVSEIPAATPLILPQNEAENVVVTPTFEWEASTAATNYKFQLSSNAADFESGIIYSATTSNLFFSVSSSLNAGQNYYWRVQSQNACGNTVSEVRTFTTEGTNAAGSLNGNAVSIFPNPVNENLWISFCQPLDEMLHVTFTTLTGQQLLQRNILPGENSAELNVADLPAGVYFLKIASNNDSLIRKVVVQ